MRASCVSGCAFCERVHGCDIVRACVLLHVHGRCKKDVQHVHLHVTVLACVHLHVHASMFVHECACVCMCVHVWG